MIGCELADYRLTRELGAGGMGTVYLAEGANGRKRAIKVVHPHLIATPGFFKRFLREATQIADLEEAHRLFQHLIDHAPEGCRESMIENVPLHKAIMEAHGDR